MKKYRVSIFEAGGKCRIVEAENANEAVKKVKVLLGFKEDALVLAKWSYC